jgi:hypothetical protein
MHNNKHMFKTRNKTKVRCLYSRPAEVRTVGAAMVLEAQRKSVKRNALIDRVLKQDLLSGGHCKLLV